MRDQDGFRLYTHPCHVVCATCINEVRDALLQAEALVSEGHTAIGWIAYEAAPAFDPAMPSKATEKLPLLWFGLYDESKPWVPGASASPSSGAWRPTVGLEEYRLSHERVRAYIASGDAYQVNLTFPLECETDATLLDIFLQLNAAQPTPYAACIRGEGWGIASLSPELFFELNGSQLVTRPMKGTRPRGRFLEEDRHLAEALSASSKDLAENLMITDLLRNDLGRVAETGSVHVPTLFTLERHPTVLQMTSTITATTAASVPEIFRALFPCGSVTGAPKIRAMEIIDELERAPRGVYCGAIGMWKPSRNVRFSVAIRTLTLDEGAQQARYSVGSGVTWDSEASDEYAECLEKSKVLTAHRPTFELLETLRLDQSGYTLLEEHLRRMRESAEYFGYPFDESTCRTLLSAIIPQDEPLRVRLLLNAQGEFRAQATPLAAAPTPFRVALHQGPVDSHDIFLYHKTTHRAPYNEALA
ncbi:MAG: hypothetical protein RLZZ303_2898, partial [Candidatus Hydrogenedentota bacterium]